MKSELLSVHFGSRAYQCIKPLHSHEHWQLEIVTQGVIHCQMLDELLSLEAGDMLLVPPVCEHGFRYHKHDVAWISLKFECEIDDFPLWGGIIHGNQFTSRLITSFKLAIHDSVFKQYEKVFVNGFLETMFHYIQSDDFHRTDDPSELLVKLITEKISMRNGKAITVNELAEELSYTRNHLSKKFKDITGENLKSYIDQIRIQKIEELLRYRELTISEIASDLGFNDLYSLSKFFKNRTGESPSQFIKNSS
ncbi:helix-turn-helix transcriptional regulator [Paenibacillus sp. UNC451MF]|uniref:helix-turn-helix transcriptional regulator n=1 Tax=Paenibacillus sp. UNC451MF TaxID=1449063 RepID=UPI00048D5227|nr:AraC family transcriptional regulator [Paenibacillus sp. UNC451MF]